MSSRLRSCAFVLRAQRTALRLFLAVSLLLTSAPPLTSATAAPVLKAEPSSGLQAVSALTTSPGSAEALEASQVVSMTSPLPTPAATFASPLPLPVPATTFASPLPTPAPLTATVSLPDKPRMTVLGSVGPEGGRLSSSDSRVKVEFAARTTSGALQVRYGARPAKPLQLKSDGREVALEFELEAWDTDKAGRELAVEGFTRPLTLTVDTQGVIDLERLPDRGRAFLAYKGPDGQWIDVPTQVNFQDGTLTAQVDHFSSWGVGVQIGTPGVWSLGYNRPEVGVFSGAATHRIPLQVPPGRNGLQPDLALSYSSARINARAGRDESVDRGPVGDGWSIDVMDIVRERWYPCTWQNGSTREGGLKCFKDVFVLLMNGTGYELAPVSAQAYGRYYAKDAPWLKVERRNLAGGNGSPVNQTTEYWMVWQPNGTVARLGYYAHAEQVTNGVCSPNPGNCRQDWNDQINNPDYAGDYGEEAVRRWRVDTITDTFNNTMTFTYQERNYNGNEIRSTLRDIYYNASLTHIYFPGWDPGPSDSENAHPTIDRVEVWTAGNNGAQQMVRQYVLQQMTYSMGGMPCNGEYISWNDTTLRSVQEKSSDESAALPTQLFGYGWYGSTDCHGLLRLTLVDNGYGGTTSFVYEEGGRSGNVRVSQVTHSGGVTGSSPIRTAYTYGTACYDEWLNASTPSPCASRPIMLADTTMGLPPAALVGHATVTENQVNEQGQSLSRAVHQYYTDERWRIGREWQTQRIDPASGAELQRQATTWNVTHFGGTTFAHADSVVTTDYSGGSSVSARVDYAYDTTYGNLTAKIEYNSNGVQYRRARWGFYPNANANQWLVNQPGYEDVAHWDGSAWVTDASTWYSYENQPYCCSTIAWPGRLTAVRLWYGPNGSNNNFVDTRYTYDAWGNRLTETTYDNYGSNNTYASGNPRSITTTYDSQYHVYPTQVTNAKGQTTQSAYNVALGLVTNMTDTNGAVTQYDYDKFGRLKKVARPGDSLNYPTEEYRYYDGGDQPFTDRWPLLVDRLVRGTAGLAWCSGGIGAWERMYYDGLGRLVERQGPGPQWDCYNASGQGQETVQYTGYNALGQVAKQSVPYFVPQYLYTTVNGKVMTPYKDPAPAQPGPIMEYDALGRVSRITAPDGTQTRHYYVVDTATNQGYTPTGLWLHSVVDANNHTRHEIQDAFGRLVRVREMNGTNPWSLYATTNYYYDALNNLTQVTDGEGNITTMTYDKLGRKITMSDPDMGAWSYVYDTRNNLTSQTDAKSQTLWFGYDEINRLAQKRLNNSGGTLLASYGYDAFDGVTQFGRGRRTSMSDTSGSASWTYDLRGRVTQETKVINSGGTFVTKWTAYDPMDRVKTMNYPGGSGGQVGEQVTYNYALQGLYSVAGSNPYVQSTAYDAPGRVTQRLLGNNQTTTYTYYPWTTANGVGRLQNITTGSLQNTSYTYDAVGNVTSVNGPDYVSFTYDALDRLTSASGAYGANYTYNAIGNLNANTSGWTYGASVSGCSSGTPATKPHAVTAANGYWYAYDCNGNMTARNSGAYTLGYDAENRLTSVSGGASATFVYDGDGNRVKGTVNGVTTVYVGNYYEVSGSTVRKYYYAGGTRVAMTENGALSWLLSDHLGSTSVTVVGTSKTGELRYSAFGTTRYTWGTTPTSRRFTGQQEEASLGLYFYQSRFYDAALGRFTQADTIVPSPGNPQSLNRYSYVLGNPLKYVDPTGHIGILATMGIGAAIGATVLGGTYAVHALATNSFDWNQLGMVTLAGAGAGALVGSGVGIAAGATAWTGAMAIATGTTIAGAGVGAAAGGEGYIVAQSLNAAVTNGQSGQFDTSDFKAAYVGGFVSGAVSSKAPIAGGALGGVTQSVLSDRFHDRDISPGRAFGGGLIGGAMGGLSKFVRIGPGIKSTQLPSGEIIEFCWKPGSSVLDKLDRGIVSTYVASDLGNQGIQSGAATTVLSGIGNAYDSWAERQYGRINK